MRVLPPAVRYIPFIDMMKPCSLADLPGSPEGREGRPRPVSKLVGWVELADMPRGVGSEILHDKRCDSFQLFVAVVKVRYDQCCYLKPYSQLPVFDDAVQHLRQFCPDNFAVEFV